MTVHAPGWQAEATAALRPRAVGQAWEADGKLPTLGAVICMYSHMNAMFVKVVEE